ncbi:MAG TPA: pyridoxal 5'-phosphate synthase glutaminase subunit PdxT [Spirochaetia bacterium]|nr:pyridoxal 5'-phosphate synthase glutaminase subunit PdxT [Spirochaetales bacterium]HRS65025.1 pyridoxal 5'-phosphate synthase glutaminase subunit PdxT [Spirochaetia bacterium]HOT59198.1 pyridoxal 5'-phosphate synthase glutaminase subunit PdxT [Spirochaetales bacterium]HPD79733.1 pyridoxal 5'-phosphate synthase glutaminase subunit PdxT [Spirochaetales bacterium]HQK34601.1 pyridoxal 5'-phosphate synthase glutaminase subunit PdxT [Spirochaetales bacterium]
MRTPRIAILGIQGGIEEHLAMLQRIPDIVSYATYKTSELASADGIILPGGESTAIGKLIEDFALKDVIKQKAQAGTPIWGTCAGAILLAKSIENDTRRHLAVMDITIKRNAYGTQINSFVTYTVLPFLGNEAFPIVCIRAPIITAVEGTARILAHLNSDIIAVQQGNLIATTFHPELTEDSRFHLWFANLVKKQTSH